MPLGTAFLRPAAAQLTKDLPAALQHVCSPEVRDSERQQRSICCLRACSLVAGPAKALTHDCTLGCLLFHPRWTTPILGELSITDNQLQRYGLAGLSKASTFFFVATDVPAGELPKAALLWIFGLGRWVWHG